MSYGIIRSNYPIRDTYRLLNNLLILTQDFPRFFRYSMEQPYGGFDFGYAFSDLQGEQQL